MNRILATVAVVGCLGVGASSPPNAFLLLVIAALAVALARSDRKLRHAEAIRDFWVGMALKAGES